MFQFQTNLSKLLFTLWVRFSQLLGLVLVDFNVKKDRFVRLKFSTAYCVCAGSVASFLYVVVLMEFYFNMRDKFAAVSFTLVISTGTEVFLYLSMILSYQQQYAMRYKIITTLNNLLLFYRRVQESLKVFKKDKQIRNCERLFFMSVLVKFSVLVLSYLSFKTLLEEKFKFWFNVLLFPMIVSHLTCNQFFLGILITKYFLATANDRLEALIEKLKFSSMNDESLIVQEELEKVSILHTKLFEFMNDLSTYFGRQTSFSIFNNFLGVTILGFQIFSTLLLWFFVNDNLLDYRKIFVIGLVNLFLTSTDVIYHLNICVMCFKEVSRS